MAAAKRAASYGAKVAIIEGDRVGGTCVIRGCVPKKLLVYGSLYKEYIEAAPGYGISFKDVKINSRVLLDNVRSEVDRLNKLHIDFLQRSGVQLIKGWASFIDSHKILVNSFESDGDNKIVFGNKILIAVGGVPIKPDIPGSEIGLVSDDMFLLEHLPKEIIIVGAGFIACEFACMLNNLGVKVRQIVRGEKILRGFDNDLSKLLQEQMESNGIMFNFNSSPISIEKKLNSIIINTNRNESFSTESILFAIGRSPRIKHMNFQSAGVLVEKNRIPIDGFQRTNVENIYAVGDVTNRINLTPVAVDEGRAFADSVFGDKPRSVNYDLVPTAVFSQPEIATVGLSEQKANEVFGDKEIIIYSAKFKPMSKALPKNGSPCLLKLVVQKSNQKIVGCHMLGEHSAEIIQMASIALLMGASKSDFDKTMALHPTVAEEFDTM